MSYIVCDQWARRTDKEKRDDWYKARARGAGTTLRPNPRRTDEQGSTSSTHRLLPGCKEVKPEEQQRRLELLRERNRRMYGE